MVPETAARAAVTASELLTRMGALVGVRHGQEWPEAFFRSAQVGDRDCCGGEPLDLVARQTNVSVARLTQLRHPAEVIEPQPECYT